MFKKQRQSTVPDPKPTIEPQENIAARVQIAPIFQKNKKGFDIASNNQKKTEKIRTPNAGSSKVKNSKTKKTVPDKKMISNMQKFWRDYRANNLPNQNNVGGDVGGDNIPDNQGNLAQDGEKQRIVSRKIAARDGSTSVSEKAKILAKTKVNPDKTWRGSEVVKSIIPLEGE